ncbi:MAG: UDP-N-acetylglucosamine 1-carboxyvinyltransferase [Planctomycetaceae bacterium]
MEMFRLEGGHPLHGEVSVSGSKNAALPMMAAAIAAPDGPTVLHGIPDLVDVNTLAELLRSLGLQVESTTHEPGKSTLVLNVCDESQYLADYELVRRMRASVCVLGPLLARRGYAKVSLPGGCQIGDRPINLHLKGLRALGANIHVEQGYVVAHARRLRGASIALGGPFGSTVTGTCNVMTAACLAEGITTIESAACEPEVVALGNLLNAMGGNITGLGTPRLTIQGVERLHGVEHTVIPDRIEAATLMIAAAITGGDVVVHNVPSSQMIAVMESLDAIGVSLETVSATEQKIASVRVNVPSHLRAVDLVALPYPGLPTDIQAQMMTLLSLAEGTSTVTDRVFPDRFMHVAELSRLGANIRREGPVAVISGIRKLSGASVMASDLRASAALVLAGLAAEGETTVRRIYHLDRGYERLDEKLNALGAVIHRVEDDPHCCKTYPIASPDIGQISGPHWTPTLSGKNRKKNVAEES